MNYELRHFNTRLLTFDVEENSETPNVKIISLDEDKKNLLPLDLELSEEGIVQWIKRRNIPKNRAYVQNFLSKCGLSINRPMNIIKISKGLSLNDCYWIVEEGFTGTFEEYNLYENKFNRVLGTIAFTGYGSNNKTSLISCPEFTTNGMLPKCWRRYKGKVQLYKGGTIGASNTGNEPYAEFYAAQIGKVLGVDIIDYKLSRWQDTLCSTCELFTSKDYAYIPAGHIIKTGGMRETYNYYEKLGPEFVQAFRNMLVLDAVICNTDRHYGNFGFLIDNSTNKIVAPAPLFDHGNSLFNYAGRDDLVSAETLKNYANTLLPRVYDDFIGTAKKALTPELHEGLRKLTTFKFDKNPRYNWDSHRLKITERVIHERAGEILKK